MPKRRWGRRLLVAVPVAIAALAAAITYVVQDPELLRGAVERVASMVTSRPVVIGELDLRFDGFAPVAEVRRVRVGQTTAERVTLVVGGLQATATGSGVRFPSESAIDRFRASLHVSFPGLVRISNVEIEGASIVGRHRTGWNRPDSSVSFQFLVVPGALVALGLERLVIHSGDIRIRGRERITTGRIAGVAKADGTDLAFHGKLSVAPHHSSLRVEGGVEDVDRDDWAARIILEGTGVPMEEARMLIGALEPAPRVRTMLERIAGTTRFAVETRFSRTGIETVDLNVSFAAPETPAGDSLRLAGLRIAARAVPRRPGWTVSGSADLSGLPDAPESALSGFTLKWPADGPGSYQFTADRIAVPALAALVRSAVPSEHPARAALSALTLRGDVEQLSLTGEGERLVIDTGIAGFGATTATASMDDLDARLVFAKGEWRAHVEDDRFQVSFPELWSAPLALGASGVLRITIGAHDWTAATGRMQIEVGDVAGRVEGSIVAPVGEDGARPRLDLRVAIAEAPLASIGALLPDRRAERFGRWYRRAVHAGAAVGASLEIRGDPARFPFSDGDGLFSASGTLKEVQFAYAEGWPVVTVAETQFNWTGSALEFFAGHGSVYETRIGEARARIPDMFHSTGEVRAHLTADGPAQDLIAFLRDSPLEARARGLSAVLRADGPTRTTLTLEIPYGRGEEPRTPSLSGTVELRGVTVSGPIRDATLENVRGVLRLTATSVDGSDLTARFEEANVRCHVDFRSGEGLRLRFAGNGDREWFGTAIAELTGLGNEYTGRWLARLDGPIPWNAEYTTRTGGVVFRSDLDGVGVDLPAPFGKPAGNPREIEVFLVPRESRWWIDARYGHGVRGAFELDQSGGRWSIARGAIALAGAIPQLPGERRIEISGHVPEFELDRWFDVLFGGAHDEADWGVPVGPIEIGTTTLQTLGHTVALRRALLLWDEDGGFRVKMDGPGATGAVTIPADLATAPVRAEFEHLHLDGRGEGEEDRSEAAPSASDRRGSYLEGGPGRFPPFSAEIGSLDVGDVQLGTVHATAVRTAAGLELRDFLASSPALEASGSGSWYETEDGAQRTRVVTRIAAPSAGPLLRAVGVSGESGARGEVKMTLDLTWPGSPDEVSMDRLEGELQLDARNGQLPDIRHGAVGRILALLSLGAIHRTLALDLSHIFGKGLAYDRIVIRSRLRDGFAEIEEFKIKSPAALIEVSGRIDLVAREFDENITVTPRLTRSGALAPIWSTAWPILVGNFLLEKLTRQDAILDRLFQLRYTLRGKLDAPRIERRAIFEAPREE